MEYSLSLIIPVDFSIQIEKTRSPTLSASTIIKGSILNIIKSLSGLPGDGGWPGVVMVTMRPRIAAGSMF